MSCLRKRGENFNRNEQTLLLKLTNKYKNIIENKKTDACTWRTREQIWKTIEKEFNNSTWGPTRTSRQLKMKYGGIKKDIKKKYVDHKKHILGTGGGAPVPQPGPSTEEEKELTETISLSVEGLESEFDNDAGYTSGINPDDLESEVVSQEVVCEWDNFESPMLQTNINPALQMNSPEQSDITISDLPVLHMDGTSSPQGDHDYVQEKENITPSEEGNNQGSNWKSRRRPVVKRKSVKSTASKFEDLASKKEKLIDKLTEMTNFQINHNQREFEKKIELLDQQREHESLKIELTRTQIDLAKKQVNS